MTIHTLFDLAAWGMAALIGYAVRRRWDAGSGFNLAGRPWYFAAAALGALVGALLLGSANTVLAGMGEGKSVLGGLLGGIVAVEAYKRLNRLSGSTGLGFVAPMAAGIAIGRVGCLLSGLDDYTYGTPTALPWGWDFGDGVPRHPVQAYESVAMLAFLGWFLHALAGGSGVARRHGFALFVLWYGGQRFAWEFLKPYPTVAGPFNLFHFGCLALMAYGLGAVLLREKIHARA
ncbi:MAG: prolipoprotein diacylglyceryl transferase [Magnetospirillum sp.]|nr:prolipoprotein diacylglyceryl transferase [Magnetospirillum sp.]